MTVAIKKVMGIPSASIKRINGIDCFTGDYLKSLLHLNGANASTTFTDEKGKTWTGYGNAQLDTADKKFGTASLLLDGTGDYIDTPDHADFDVGSGDFTIDCWIRRAATGAWMVISGQNKSDNTAANRSWYMYFTNTDYIQYAILSGTTFCWANSDSKITDTASFHHIAMVRNGNVLKLAIDGAFGATTVNVTGITANNSAYKVAIGRDGELDNFYFNGWIDEFRFTKGLALWTANFTPPTAEGVINKVKKYMGISNV